MVELEPMEQISSRTPAASAAVLSTARLSVTAGPRELFPPITVTIPGHKVFGILGPSGAGKSTFLKCLNRLIDLTPNLRVKGDVLWHGRSIFSSDTDVDALRARIGMIFQQPVV